MIKSNLKLINFCRPQFICFVRKCSQKVIESNYAIDEFSKIYINSPFSLNIQPLDYHNNFNNNELKIKLVTPLNSTANVECRIKEDLVTIVGENGETVDDTTCFINAPIKSGSLFFWFN